MLLRTRHLERIRALLNAFPVVAVVGARQVGKTTLAREIAAVAGATAFDLEDPVDVLKLADPGLALRPLRGLVVIDEVQRMPSLFPLLRVLVDRPDNAARFLLLGSASPDLVKSGSETLAGRVAYHPVHGFALDEVGIPALHELWLRGGFPPSFLAPDDQASFEWRRQFASTFLDRELQPLGYDVGPATLRRFWAMLAHWHGQVWNASEFGRAFGVSDSTVRRYLDLLEGTFVVDLLQPWHENLAKRQVRSPKVYIADSGLLHTLLGLRTRDDLAVHPKIGASFEGFAAACVRRHLRAGPEECFFWSTHGGAELDLLIVRGVRRLGFEFKLAEAPSSTRSMHVALADLRLDRLDVIHGGDQTFQLGDRLRAVALSRIAEDLDPLA